MDDFYDKDKVETPLSPEEAAKKLAEDEAAASGKKDKKKEKGKKKKKGKAKGGGGDDNDSNAVIKIGPSEVVHKFEEFYDDYTDEWANRDESENREQ